MKFNAWLEIKKFDPNEVKMGIEAEKEHDKDDNLNIIHGNKEKLLKVVIAHLREDPKYYTKLKKAKL